MTTIKEVISSILRDVVQAQHEVNAYARDLTHSSLSNVEASAISPAVGVGELTVHLKFAILEGEKVTEVQVLNKAENDRLLGNLSEQLAKLMIRKFVTQVQQSGLPYEDKGFSYISDLGDHQRLIDYLSHHIRTALLNNIKTLYNREHRLEVEPIADQVLAVGEQYLFSHSDIEGLFALPGGQDLLEKTRQILDNDVSKEIKKIIQEEEDAHLYQCRTNRSLHIETEAERLKEYPGETIQSLSLTIVSRQSQEASVAR